MVTPALTSFRPTDRPPTFANLITGDFPSENLVNKKSENVQIITYFLSLARYLKSIVTVLIKILSAFFKSVSPCNIYYSVSY